VGTTANAVTSLSLDPPLILVCFDLGSRGVEQPRRVPGQIHHGVGRGARQGRGQRAGHCEGDAVGARRGLRVAGDHGYLHDVNRRWRGTPR
jgi:hypothetical protein